MKRTLDHALGLFRKPSQELEQSIQERVAKRLGLDTGDVVHDTRHSTRTRRWQWSAVAVIAAAVMLAVFLPTRIAQSARAVLEDANGSRKIHYGEIVQPSGDMSSMLSITDGPRVEARSMSEFSLERADDGGTRIHLNYGSLVVDAAGQHKGGLYVQTGDMTASVAGAVSLVKAEEQGSRVAAIGGEIRVQQGSTEKKLTAGEQMTSNPAMETLSVKDELAWSREAVSHVALLQLAPAVRAAQTPKLERLAFEVVSIRSSGPPAPPVPGARGGGGDANSRPTRDGCSFTSMGYTEQLDARRFAVTRSTVLQLIAWAYPVQSVPKRQPTGVCGVSASVGLLSGGPEWIRTDMWDIQAGILEGVFSSKPGLFDPKLQQMLQAMLVERFNLAIRRETRQVPVYLLKVGKRGTKFNGPGENIKRMVFLDSDGKIKPASEFPPPSDGDISMIGSRFFEAQNVSMANLADDLFGIDARPVLDRTGIGGRYDFHFYRPAGGPFDARSLGQAAAALKREAIESVGLELEEARAPFDVWVIERLEKPSEN